MPRHETGFSIFSGDTNLSLGERAASVVAGLALAAVAAQPRPNRWLSLAALLTGSYLAVRGATGHCALKQVRDSTAHLGLPDARHPDYV